MPNSKLTMIARAVGTTIVILWLSSLPGNATILKQDLLKLPTEIVRDRLITEGITAYQQGYYDSSVYLLRNFLSPRRLITTPEEKLGINYLALAYQAVGESASATATIKRAIAVRNNSPLELALSEYHAGIIAFEQNRLTIANQHWEKARSLYKNQNRNHEWKKTTLKLFQNYSELGNLPKSRQLLQELKTVE